MKQIKKINTLITYLTAKHILSYIHRHAGSHSTKKSCLREYQCYTNKTSFNIKYTEFIPQYLGVSRVDNWGELANRFLLIVCKYSTLTNEH